MKEAINQIKRIALARKRASEAHPIANKEPKVLSKDKADIYSNPIYYARQLWLTQAKQLLRLFNADLKAFVNGLIKIND